MKHLERLLVHAVVWLIVAVAFIPLMIAMAVADWRDERDRLAHDLDDPVDWRTVPRVETELRLPGVSREDCKGAPQ